MSPISFHFKKRYPFLFSLHQIARSSLIKPFANVNSNYLKSFTPCRGPLLVIYLYLKFLALFFVAFLLSIYISSSLHFNILLFSFSLSFLLLHLRMYFFLFILPVSKYISFSSSLICFLFILVSSAKCDSKKSTIVVTSMLPFQNIFITIPKQMQAVQCQISTKQKYREISRKQENRQILSPNRKKQTNLV